MADERAFTASLARFFAAPAGVRVPIGDDAAEVPNRGRESVLCCDPVVERVHFARGADLALVGRKAVNRNLADLAAMGARPDWLLVSLVLPRAMAAAARTRLLRGIRAAARAGRCAVVGGDVATHRGPLVVTVTAVGHLRGRALLRSAARAGDSIHLTGPVGNSRAGHHLSFRPPLAEGEWLARHGGAAAAIDVSDGLLLDLWTVLAASGGLGAELHEDAIPRRPGVGAGRRALLRALAEGEDHVLLFTVRSGRRLRRGGPLRALARRPIGRVVSRPGLWLVDSRGKRTRLLARGWQHALAGA
jgi:thiamine-monophosphate kinase